MAYVDQYLTYRYLTREVRTMTAAAIISFAISMMMLDQGAVGTGLFFLFMAGVFAYKRLSR